MTGNLPERVAASSEIVLYQVEDGQSRIEVRLDGETVWLSQALMAELFQTTVPNINIHIRNIYEDGELAPEATVKDYLMVQYDRFSKRRLIEEAAAEDDAFDGLARRIEKDGEGSES